jgi:hypothetical protein
VVVLRIRAVAETVVLGEVTCPSGQLVLMDGGYLDLWSGSRPPAHDVGCYADFEIVGADAAASAAVFDRQSGLTAYDIPDHGIVEFTARFDALIHEHGFDASLQQFPTQVPHRDRVRRAIAGGDRDFLITGVPVISVGALPTDRPLVVSAAPGGGWGWEYIRIAVSDEPVASVRALGSVGVDFARFVFADADALDSWQHEETIDGLADTVFWGRDQDAVAARFGAGTTGVAGDDVYGWLGLPIRDAYAKAVALDEWRNGDSGQRFAYDFRPHSHHWQVMAGVRGSEHEAATIEVGDATIMFAMTSVGDGVFPVHLELDATGASAGIRIIVADIDIDNEE